MTLAKMQCQPLGGRARPALGDTSAGAIQDISYTNVNRHTGSTTSHDTLHCAAVLIGAAGAVQVLESPGNYFEEPGEYSPRLFFYPQVMKMR